jgi:thiol-disulfide isomerase/thioredoxin
MNMYNKCIQSNRTRTWAAYLFLVANFAGFSADAEKFGGVEFPQGAISFADALVSYNPAIVNGQPTEAHRDPLKALGPPDNSSSSICSDSLSCHSVTLGNGGSIVLQFTDNALTGSGNSNMDLWIFEIWSDVEDTFIDVSRDGTKWETVGKVGGATSGIDIDAYGFGPGDRFYFVRLTDDPNEGEKSGASVGADIDAIGAISTVLASPLLERSPATLSQTVNQGQNATSQVFEVWNGRAGTMNYSISENVSWLSLSSTSGTSTGEHDRVTVNYATAGLVVGTYSATVTVSAANAEGSPKTILVTLEVRAENSLCDKITMVQGQCFEPGDGKCLYLIEFCGTWCGPCKQVPPIMNRLLDTYGGRGLNVLGVFIRDTRTAVQSYLTNNSVRYAAGFAKDAISWDPLGFGLTYVPYAVLLNDQGAVLWAGHPVTSSSNLEATVKASLCGNSPLLERSPAILSQTITQGQNAPAQSFTVRNAGGGTLSYSISEAVTWLSVTPASGTSTGETDTITVNYNTAGLAPGTHTATLTITAAGATGSPRYIPVTLTVLAPPTVINNRPMDFNGDGKEDLCVFEPASGKWFIQQSGSKVPFIHGFGWNAVIPLGADYDGDGKMDLCVYFPGTGTWYVRPSGTGKVLQMNFGWFAAMPVPADYDGDGQTDLAVFHPATGNWYIRQTASNSTTRLQQFGGPGAMPVPADYDGDGKADLAVYLPANGTWYILQSKTGTLRNQQFGWSAAEPVPADYDGDGNTDLAVYHAATRTWYIRNNATGKVATFVTGGTALTDPVPADYDGDGKADLATFDGTTGTWIVRHSSNGITYVKNWGYYGCHPVQPRYHAKLWLGLW